MLSQACIWYSNTTVHLQSDKYSRNLVFDNFDRPIDQLTDRPTEAGCRSSKQSLKIGAWSYGGKPPHVRKGLRSTAQEFQTLHGQTN